MPQQEGAAILECLKSRGRLLLPRDVRAVRCLLSMEARLIHIKHLVGRVPPLLDDGLEFVQERSSGVGVSAPSLTRVPDATEGRAGLELVEPALAGYKFWYGAHLLRLQVVVAVHGLPFDVVRRHV